MHRLEGEPAIADGDLDATDHPDAGVAHRDADERAGGHPGGEAPPGHDRQGNRPQQADGRKHIRDGVVGGR